MNNLLGESFPLKGWRNCIFSKNPTKSCASCILNKSESHSCYLNTIYSAVVPPSFKDIYDFGWYTDEKENQIFLIYKEIQSGAVAMSYMRKDFLIYDKMCKYFPIYEEAVSHRLSNCSTLNFLIYEENLFFLSMNILEFGRDIKSVLQVNFS
jgi:hypothetical protein